MRINCIAIDDEPLALEKMVNYISKLDYLDLIAEFDNGLDALNYLKDHEVDLLFLDIQMADLTGIQLIEIMQNPPKIILTTAYSEYALKGYELDVVDYLLKPISFDRFLKAVEKVYKQISNQVPEVKQLNHSDDQKDKEFIFIKADYKLHKVRFDEILYIEGMKDYLRVHTDSKKLMTLTSFNKLEKFLPDEKFIRIHRSYIISLDKVEQIEKQHVKIGEVSIPISDSYKELFFQSLRNNELISDN
ncbi:LytR/AlgR family response regulator transcription factor [Bacteroidota bacterium]